MREPEYDLLLGAARARDDMMSLVFAGAISRAIAEGRRPIIRGLSEGRFARLLNEYFPEVEMRNGADTAPGSDQTEYMEVVEMLLRNRVEPTEQRAWLSYAIASAAFISGPLWVELGLPSEQLLVDVFATHFPAIAAGNADGKQDWKQVFHQLA